MKISQDDLGKRPNRVTAETIVQLLNELLELDRPAISNLLTHRQACNEDLADHPTVPSRAGPWLASEIGCRETGYPPLGDGQFDIGVLGLLNGMLAGTGKEIFITFQDGWVESFAVGNAGDWVGRMGVGQ